MLNTALLGAALIVAVSSWQVSAAIRTGLAAAVTGSILLASVLDAPEAGISNAIDATYLVLMALVVFARFRRDLVVTAQSVLAAVCVYLVLGLLFANLDHAVSRVEGRPFFAQSPSASESEYVYFSFITLATVGYGDFTPASGTSRALAVTEALTGQLYLVTVIALVVGNLGRERRGRQPLDKEPG